MVMMTHDTDLLELLFGDQNNFLTMNGEVVPPLAEVSDQRLDLNEYQHTDEDNVTLIPDMDSLLDFDACPKEVEVTIEIPAETPSTSFSDQQENLVFQFPSTSQESEMSDDLLSIATDVSLLTDFTDTDSMVPQTPFSPDSPFSLMSDTTDTLSSSDTHVRKSSVKDDLRNRIKIKRKQEGKGDIKVEFKPPEPERLTKEEVGKRLEKREKNKLAAQKCREKKRNRADTLEREIRTLQTKQSGFELDIKKLIEERDNLRDIINVHSSVCPNIQVHASCF